MEPTSFDASKFRRSLIKKLKIRDTKLFDELLISCEAVIAGGSVLQSYSDYKDVDFDICVNKRNLVQLIDEFNAKN